MKHHTGALFAPWLSCGNRLQSNKPKSALHTISDCTATTKAEHVVTGSPLWYLNEAIWYDLFKGTLLFKSIPQPPIAQANDLLPDCTDNPEASHWLCIIKSCPKVSVFIAVLLQADKRHSYNTQMEKQPDKEDCIIRNMSGGKRWGLETYWVEWW